MTKLNRASPARQGWGERFAPEGGIEAEASWRATLKRQCPHAAVTAGSVANTWKEVMQDGRYHTEGVQVPPLHRAETRPPRIPLAGPSGKGGGGVVFPHGGHVLAHPAKDWDGEERTQARFPLAVRDGEAVYVPAPPLPHLRRHRRQLLRLDEERQRTQEKGQSRSQVPPAAQAVLQNHLEVGGDSAEEGPPHPLQRQGERAAGHSLGVRPAQAGRNRLEEDGRL